MLIVSSMCNITIETGGRNRIHEFVNLFCFVSAAKFTFADQIAHKKDFSFQNGRPS